MCDFKISYDKNQIFLMIWR